MQRVLKLTLVALWISLAAALPARAGLFNTVNPGYPVTTSGTSTNGQPASWRTKGHVYCRVNDAVDTLIFEEHDGTACDGPANGHKSYIDIEITAAPAAGDSVSVWYQKKVFKNGTATQSSTIWQAVMTSQHLGEGWTAWSDIASLGNEPFLPLDVLQFKVGSWQGVKDNWTARAATNQLNAAPGDP